MKQLVYPLEQVLEVKNKRVEEAARVVAEKQETLEREREKLKRVEAERDKVRSHYKDKLQQLRQALDNGESTDKIQMMRRYMQVVEEKLAVEEDKVKKQTLEVQQATVALEEAQDQWRQRIKEADKLKEHRRMWIKQALFEQAQELAKEEDELGSIMFLGNRDRYK